MRKKKGKKGKKHQHKKGKRKRERNSSLGDSVIASKYQEKKVRHSPN
jgi:hypothetical protein